MKIIFFTLLFLLLPVYGSCQDRFSRIENSKVVRPDGKIYNEITYYQDTNNDIVVDLTDNLTDICKFSKTAKIKLCTGQNDIS